MVMGFILHATRRMWHNFYFSNISGVNSQIFWFGSAYDNALIGETQYSIEVCNW